MDNPKKFNRRDFFKTAAAGLGGYVMLSPDKAVEPKPNPAKQRKTIYRTLGKTGIKVPVISMGVMNADNPNLVKAALDNGIVHLDTAWNYQRGRNEKIIGSVIKDYSRDSFIIGTKIHDQSRDREKGTFTREATAEKFLEKFDESLNRLGLEYVDILYLHSVWTRQMALYEPFMQALEKLKKEGRTRFVGVSTHWGEPEVIQAAIDSNFYDVVLTSYNFKQDHIKEIQQAVARAAEAGLGIIGMKTFAGGYLDEEKTKPVDPKAAIRFALKDKNVHTIIPGFTTFEQMEIDLSVMEDLSFKEKDSEVLELGCNSRGGVYCQGCQTCVNQCPKHLPIPDLMRAHMYAYAYKNHWAAKDLVSSLNVELGQCDDCTVCTVNCVKGFNIKQKFTEVASLKSVPSRFFV
ncbi:MAG: aldo/keto reductase [Candidatus Marinimicrobia bacterium]|nr:aldo/keto reductase [bacterium]MCG2715509.1 aldo/keto reductase [Candidatus Neomarinimicrobiota bacterium]